jgi:hypothetical protein
MAREWIDVPLQSELFKNLPEAVLRRSPVALENAFINEGNGHSRFPGLADWTNIAGGGKVYLAESRGSMVAVTSHGRIVEIDKVKTQYDRTGVFPGGIQRPSFAVTDDERLLIAAGGPIVQLKEDKSTLLSSSAPMASHVGWTAGYVLAVEPDSQLVNYSENGVYENWPGINFFSAESRPDNITSMVISEFGEILLAGPLSVEQFEPYPSGDQPFFRRWSNGEGIKEGAQATLIAADSGIWGINRLAQFTQYRGQSAKPLSSQIAYDLQKITNWEGSWSAVIRGFGQNFIMIQIPNQVDPVYGGLGMTLLYDDRNKRWAFLYGWDEQTSEPGPYPANSYLPLWGRHFVGGNDGQIYELTDTTHMNGGQRQQMYWRSAHMDDMGKTRIDGVRFRLKRGSIENTYTMNPDFQIRWTRDNTRKSIWQTGKLGLSGDNAMYIEFGQQGTGITHQIEYRCGADVPVEVVRMQVRATQVD